MSRDAGMARLDRQRRAFAVLRFEASLRRGGLGLWLRDFGFRVSGLGLGFRV